MGMAKDGGVYGIEKREKVWNKNFNPKPKKKEEV